MPLFGFSFVSVYCSIGFLANKPNVMLYLHIIPTYVCKWKTDQLILIIYLFIFIYVFIVERKAEESSKDS